MKWLDTFFSAVLSVRYWVCGHTWCYREATYDYRCHLHQGDK